MAIIMNNASPTKETTFEILWDESAITGQTKTYNHTNNDYDSAFLILTTGQNVTVNSANCTLEEFHTWTANYWYGAKIYKVSNLNTNSTISVQDSSGTVGIGLLGYAD